MDPLYIGLGLIVLGAILWIVFAHYKGSDPHAGERKSDLWRWFR